MATTTRPRAFERVAAIVSAPLVWLERARGRRRLALLTLYGLVVALVAAFGWWSISLNGLPDVGDPFDVKAFQSRAANVPADEDALPLYRDAFAAFREMPNGEDQAASAILQFGLSRASPRFLAWMKDNRASLELWRRATERPRVSSSWPGSYEREIYLRHRSFSQWSILALLEAKRLEDQGDRAGAWKWYRAILRSSRHAAMYGSHFDRITGDILMTHVALPLQRWAEDPKTDGALLRHALDELKAVDAMTPPDSDHMRTEYLLVMHELDETGPSRTYGPTPSEDQWYKFLPLYPQLQRLALREPERSRRALRLIFANQLRYVDLPLLQRPPMVPPGLYDTSSDPSAPWPTRAMAPEDLSKWLDTCLYAPYLRERDWGAPAHDGQIRAQLLVTVARELYRREHGTPPKTDQALVGSYLDSSVLGRMSVVTFGQTGMMRPAAPTPGPPLLEPGAEEPAPPEAERLQP